MRDLRISRRTLLRGTGAAIALPFLEAMLPRTLLAAPAAKTPLRAAFFYMPVGANMDAWRQPKTPGLPETLEPLVAGRLQEPALAALAVRIGATRLIDNLMLGSP